MAEKKRTERDKTNTSGRTDEALDEEVDAEAMSAGRVEPRITGVVAAECGPVLSASCPWCRRIHCRPLGHADHLEIMGRRYWRETCGRHVFLVQVEGHEIVAALAEARRITAQEGLSTTWLDHCAPPAREGASHAYERALSSCAVGVFAPVWAPWSGPLFVA
jgi:hypothetical protein